MLPPEIVKRAEKKNILLACSFELTYGCNQKCIHCYQPSPHRADGELTTDEVKDVLDQLVKERCLCLAFTGGEPVLRSDFWEIAEYARKKAFAINLQTNGTLLDSTQCDLIKELNFVDVQISLLGARDSTHETITRTKGSFKIVLKVAELLKERGVTVAFKITLIKENMHEMEDMERLAKDMDIVPMFSPTVFPLIDGKSSPLEHRLDDEQLKKVFSGRLKKGLNDFTPLVDEPGDFPLCQMGRSQSCITPQGDVYPCVCMPILLGNLREKKLIDIWRNSKELGLIRTFKVKDYKRCPNCDLFSSCMHCPALGYLEEGDLLVPSKETCRITRTMKEVIDCEKEKV